jgi:hypothetical protein
MAQLVVQTAVVYLACWGLQMPQHARAQAQVRMDVSSVEMASADFTRGIHGMRMPPMRVSDPMPMPMRLAMGFFYRLSDAGPVD